MLPIRSDYLPKGFTKERGKFIYDFEERTDIQKLHPLLIESGWNRKFYKIDNDVKRYNEISYFHSYACKTLFDMQFRSEETIDVIDPNKVMIYYEKEIQEGAYYEIKTNDRTYKLSLTDLNLHVYNTGVAILVISSENHAYIDKEDILRINEYGRRVYPPFLSEKNPLLTRTAKGVMLADSLEIWTGNVNDPILYEDFSWYDDLSQNNTYFWENGEYQYHNFIIFPKIISGLFNENFTFDAQGEFDELNQRENKVRFNFITDDRMFFQCWYGNNDLAKELKEKSFSYHEMEKNGEKMKIKNQTLYGYEDHLYWYAFMNGDAKSESITCQHDVMLEEEIANSTYNRWANYGTLFGFTRDSFVAISDDLNTLLKNNAPNLAIHFTSIYYQMAMLSLAQRASILRFSSEVANLGDIGKDDGDKAVKLIEKLYLNYIEFVNKLYFREITPAIQGIEIYDQFQTVMRIEHDANALKEEMKELYDFAMLKKQDILTEIATFYLPFALVFGILGANFFNDKNFNVEEGIDWNIILWIAIGLLISFVLSLLTRNIYNIKSKTNKFFKWIQLLV